MIAVLIIQSSFKKYLKTFISDLAASNHNYCTSLLDGKQSYVIVLSLRLNFHLIRSNLCNHQKVTTYAHHISPSISIIYLRDNLTWSAIARASNGVAIQTNLHQEPVHGSFELILSCNKILYSKLKYAFESSLWINLISSGVWVAIIDLKVAKYRTSKPCSRDLLSNV